MAMHVKNLLQMVGGYRPYQLVYGRNPKLPSVLTDAPPAPEGTSISSTFSAHLNTMHAGRKAFIKAEVSERIRRTLRHRIRPWGEYFEKGNRVYYKREGKKECKGQAKVGRRQGSYIATR